MKVLTAKEFRRMGKAWGGYGWQAALAIPLGRSKRTIGLYCAGTINVPPAVRAKFALIIASKGEALLDDARDLLA